MELCVISLEQYIRAENVRELDHWKEYQKIVKAPTNPSSEAIVVMPSPVQAQVPLSAIYIILQHIVNGLLYIHCLREVHRDLSPHNGMLICFWLTGCSPFQKRLLEDR